MCLRARQLAVNAAESEFPTTQSSFLGFKHFEMLQKKKGKQQNVYQWRFSFYAENIDSGPNILPE